MAAFSFDLSTLTPPLRPGLYKIKVKATAADYRDSDFSNIVMYQVGHKLEVSYAKGTYEAPTYVSPSENFSINITPNQGEELPKEGDLQIRNATLVSYESTATGATITLNNAIGTVVVRIGSGAAEPMISADDKLITTWDDKQLVYNIEGE